MCYPGVIDYSKPAQDERHNGNILQQPTPSLLNKTLFEDGPNTKTAMKSQYGEFSANIRNVVSYGSCM
jgi:hypothetical protein